MKLPSAFHENFFSQPVAISGSTARMIRLAVTLNAECEKAGVMRMFHTQINEVASH